MNELIQDGSIKYKEDIYTFRVFVKDQTRVREIMDKFPDRLTFLVSVIYNQCDSKTEFRYLLNQNKIFVNTKNGASCTNLSTMVIILKSLRLLILGEDLVVRSKLFFFLLDPSNPSVLELRVVTLAS